MNSFMLRNIIIWVMILVLFTIFFNFIFNYKKNKYEIWSYSLPEFSTSPIYIFDDDLYFSDEKNHLYSISKNGKTKWALDLKCPLDENIKITKDYIFIRTLSAYQTFYSNSVSNCRNPDRIHIINRSSGNLNHIIEHETYIFTHQKNNDYIIYSGGTKLYNYSLEKYKSDILINLFKENNRISGFNSDFHINENILYVKNFLQDVFAFNIEHNRLKWQFTSNWIFRERDTVDEGRTSRSLIYDDNVIYTVNKVQHSTAADVYAFDANTGRILGRRHIEAGASPGRLSSSSRNIYVSSNDGRVHALSKRNLYPVWDVPVRGRVLGALVPYEGRVYAGTQAGGIIGLDEKTGKRVYYYPTRHPIPGTPAIEDGIIYFATNGGSIHAVRLPEDHTSASTDGKN